MKTFEYKSVQSFRLPIQESELNKLGADGWDLIKIFETRDYYNYLFKRETRPL